jgi:Reverse transcriptase (RNA-dependent DNA polymerase)
LIFSQCLVGSKRSCPCLSLKVILDCPGSRIYLNSLLNSQLMNLLTYTTPRCLRYLTNRFGVVGTALNWFRLYLTNWSYALMYGSNLSDVVQLVCLVPQGSILGPLLSVLYTAELKDVADSIGARIHMYTDDPQPYVHCKPSGMIGAVTRLEQCIDRADKWMAASRLKLNSDKSEVI